MTRDRLAKLGWIAVAAWVVLYAPMAFEYMSRFFFHGPALWDHAYSGVVGNQQALGPESVYVVQSTRYHDNAIAMALHTALGALAILLAVFQLSARSRRRLAVHRWLGRVQVPLVIASMLTAMGFLIAVHPNGTFDGASFYLQLWALAAGTLLGTTFGWFAIRRRQIAAHRIAMTYAFALLCTAPFLRLGYLVFGLAWPHGTQATSNLMGAAILSFAAPSGAFVAARFVKAPRASRHLGARLTSPVMALLAAAGILGAAMLAWQYTQHFAGLDRITACWLSVAILVLAVAVRQRRTATDETAKQDWSAYLAAVLVSFPVAAALWVLFGAMFGPTAGFYGALLVGPGATISVGLMVIIASRWRVVRREVVQRPPSVGIDIALESTIVP